MFSMDKKFSALFVGFFAAAFLYFFPFFCFAGILTQVSDLITDSGPSATSSHTISFRLVNTVPASGKIIVVFDGGLFTVSNDLDFNDIDVSFSTTSATSTYFEERTLAAVPSATDDGVSVQTGNIDTITITLNSSSGFSAGDYIKIEIGSAASYQGAGSDSIANPSFFRSYHIRIYTQNAGGVEIDRGTAMIAVVEKVAVVASPLVEPPILSNGLPSGVVAAGNPTIEISLNTNKNSWCRYATTSGIDYDLMTNNFTLSGSTTHAVVLTGFQDGQAYVYYVRCEDFAGTETDSDYLISFSLAETPPPLGTPLPTGTPAPTAGPPGPGGSIFIQSGNILGGSQNLYLSSITLEGWAFPMSSVSILKDGVLYRRSFADGTGKFIDTVVELERGTYTFIVYAVDSKGRKSASFSSTMTLLQASNNKISDIVIPPTVVVDKENIKSGDKVTISGESVPGARVEIVVKKQSEVILVSAVKKYYATSSLGVAGVADGIWSVEVDTAGFDDGTYEISARTTTGAGKESDYSRVLFLGVGETAGPDFGLRADLNKDGKVNLVDFSILLVYWKTSDANADINSDGAVNLGDFSIMLFYWTG